MITGERVELDGKNYLFTSIAGNEIGTGVLVTPERSSRANFQTETRDRDMYTAGNRHSQANGHAFLTKASITGRSSGNRH